ncbi:predicted protein [Aspergillus nidulans FGSC A4]|uniref:Uncharacterized protein n=1 Tax=Emericella nidulans (strain FGSC A4 / ATCC 38163 / CBS 112.46 / NRRL 194 / M139) TaxID=227321 RepID=Q5B426_EMENI|nr:hypothetical protein [Aspergillus nidulans FGSC A4]EAA60746.1 predicted protein [Aspergillus nidulans FGSC A4]CBF76961.1 TPA: hypothetical protein ANIA_04704 [Aspergillus nidulans FGSC A4]|eukprot:XP_662308.1 predicted protein [Aspergillus nidulans FGSC A4]
MQFRIPETTAELQQSCKTKKVYLIARLHLDIIIFSEIIEGRCIMVDFVCRVARITNVLFPKMKIANVVQFKMERNGVYDFVRANARRVSVLLCPVRVCPGGTGTFIYAPKERVRHL